ncbi:malto-oligosyltrehalose trehalohydrolase [Enemella dayhoffiae]|uniref:Malto-oligosyltrehalose trehalohydrolase n=1 Tax=Enemella dayhoffiae TaxID=2016507 RepID=A0A255GXS4_9ACTN|nr:malto-oligosyltrehalose trehalohydrolase [Enemella dayhoffiae]OYO18404.1 malto-oligosyltrehalose trehalohydrolase [Enemella dayhoffiae]
MSTSVSFKVWGPTVQRMTLQVNGTAHEMAKGPDAWWRPSEYLPDEYFRSGNDYGYLVDDGDTPLPDPRTRWQPDGPHGLSRTYDLADHQWGDQAWTGRQLAGGVIYELHVGTFTAGPDGRGGTLDSAIERLDHLVELGVDFVELMPVNEFNGEHGWGYDGVDWYAVHHAYGGPAAYQRFVDACHQRGLGVIQDVVYNHLGPSGNYLPSFGPYLNDAVQSPWGAAINLDGEESDEVRRYIVENALMWLRDLHVDGLRLDAVHALLDHRAVHLLEELSTEVDALSAFVGRPLSLIAESDLNDPRMITPREAGGYGLAAQWSDDFHHALLANLTGDSSGYYADFASLEALAKVFQTGFFHDGTVSTFRGRRHGRPMDTSRTPTWRLVVCSDNHDQIGNRADGRRLSKTLTSDQLVLAAALILLGPGTPMIFMGEEWGAGTPWAFFTSHPEPELGEAVSKGRLEEFAKMEWGDVEVPDPQDEATFTGSILDWSELGEAEHAELFATYRELIRLRRTHPDITDPRFEWTSVEHDAEDRWFLVARGERLTIVVNFGDDDANVPLEDDSDFLFSRGGLDLTRTEDGFNLRMDPWSMALLELKERPYPHV